MPTTATYDAWFRRKLDEALADSRPDIPHEIVEAEFTARRVETLRKLHDGEIRASGLHTDG